MAEIKLVHEYNKYPDISQVTKDAQETGIKIIHSPFANCQSFSILAAQNLLRFDEDEFKQFIRLAYNTIGKHQFVIDIYQSIVKEMSIQLAPYLGEFKSLKYKSTNGTQMQLCLIQLNLDTVQRL